MIKSYKIQEYKDIKEFVIKRSEWSRGTQEGLLLNNYGKKCCLGFYAEACGIPAEEIIDIATPQDLVYGTDVAESNNLKWDTFLIDKKKVSPSPYDRWSQNNSSSCCAMMETNDLLTRAITESEREEQLIKLFADQGVKVTFVD